jgi:hypothetical protein
MNLSSIICFILFALTYARLELRAIDDSSFSNEATTPKDDWIAIAKDAFEGARTLADRARSLPDGHPYWTQFFGATRGQGRAATVRGSSLRITLWT